MDPKMKILVVDDFSTMRRIIKNLLKQIGYENIGEAEDGMQALEALKQQKFDLVITDLNMPNMDGIKLTKMLRGEEELKHLPILLVTAESDKIKVIEAIRAGISNYIVKPFVGEVLQEKIYKIFGKTQVK
jgi:two-component system chemotaxis response regulator CheY